MSAWVHALHELALAGGPAVVVTVAGVRGSAPREVGAKMIVTGETTRGSVGGGQLEYQCVRRAAAWLRDGASLRGSRLERFVLGADCGQCCGGVAEMLFERVDEHDAAWLGRLADALEEGARACVVTARQSRGRAAKWVITQRDAFAAGAGDPPSPATVALARARLAHGGGACAANLALPGKATTSVLLEPLAAEPFTIAIFGAGHVGSACARVLSVLDARVLLVDSRTDILAAARCEGVRALLAPVPVAVVDTLPPHSYYLVMTHDHGLDLELCARILARADSAYCGLIGSRSKRRRFEKRLRALGLADAALRHLTCPIGAADIGSKQPGHIAVAAAAQVLARRESAAAQVAPARTTVQRS